jgi:hypothetical protein
VDGKYARNNSDTIEDLGSGKTDKVLLAPVKHKTVWSNSAFCVLVVLLSNLDLLKAHKKIHGV